MKQPIKIFFSHQRHSDLKWEHLFSWYVIYNGVRYGSSEWINLTLKHNVKKSLLQLKDEVATIKIRLLSKVKECTDHIKKYPKEHAQYGIWICDIDVLEELLQIKLYKSFEDVENDFFNYFVTL